MEIITLSREHLADASALFTENYRALRALVPILPQEMENPTQVEIRLNELIRAGTGVGATDNGRLVGYMCGFTIENFRNSDRKAAYSPEWAHSASGSKRADVYRAMYRSISAGWLKSGCQAHAISLLAHDDEAWKTWFWSGFGLTCVDAIRPMRGLGLERCNSVTVRMASADDAETLQALDIEHCAHYREPPTLMPPPAPHNSQSFRDFMNDPVNNVMLALVEGEPVGFMMGEGKSFGAADIVTATDTLALTGAYVRRSERGKGVASALLDAMLREGETKGYARCSVDFESINPEATAFWLRYFEPVCLSLIRVPERPPD